jgi:hypothetical protein
VSDTPARALRLEAVVATLAANKQKDSDMDAERVKRTLGDSFGIDFDKLTHNEARMRFNAAGMSLGRKKATLKVNYINALKEAAEAGGQEMQRNA